jgi:hypothetical protein
MTTTIKKRNEYLIKALCLSENIETLTNEMEENSTMIGTAFDLGLPINKEFTRRIDIAGAKLNRAITDLKYYKRLLEETEDFSFQLN